MKRTLFTVTGLALLAGLLFVSGPATAQSAAGLVGIASADADPAARQAAADVLSQDWINRETGGTEPVSGSTLWDQNDVTPSGTSQGRMLGFATQRARIFSAGDPIVGQPIATSDADNTQLYADMALAENAPTVPVERLFVRAAAAVFNIRTGFAIVPGGPSEAFNRIQSCLLDGSLKSNQGNKVSGVSLDCSSETIRRAISDFVASGFYNRFGDLPAVDFSCDAIRSQAEGGPNVAARWAAARAYVNGCVDHSVDTLTDLASNGGSAELQFAAVGPLAEALAATGATAEDHLGHVEQFSGNVALAHAWAAGLHLAKEVSADSDGNPTTPTTGNLRKFSASNLDNAKNAAAIAPFAEFFANQAGLDLGRISLTVSMDVSGASLPLQSTVQTLP